MDWLGSWLASWAGGWFGGGAPAGPSIAVRSFAPREERRWSTREDAARIGGRREERHPVVASHREESA